FAEDEAHSASRLADDVARLLADEPDVGLSCDRIAKRLHRRRAAVLATLRADERFERVGTTNGARWTLGTERDGIARGTTLADVLRALREFRDVLEAYNASEARA